MQFQTVHGASIRSLADALIACPVGEVITHRALSNTAGVDTQHRRYLVLAALTLANKETGANFRNKFGVGYERLPAALAHTVGKAARAKGRRTFRRASESISNTLSKANDISDADRLKAFREQASLGLLQHMARDRSLPPVREDAPLPDLAVTVRASIAALRAHLTMMYG